MAVHPSLPVNEDALAISFLQPGHSEQLKDGWADTKTVPYAIIVQPLTGSYTVTCAGKTAGVTPGETVLIPADTEVTFVHHGPKGKSMGVRWVHINWTLLGTVNFTSLLDIPIKVSGPVSDKFTKTINAIVDLKERPGGSPLIWLLERNQLGFALLRLVLEASVEKETIGDYIGRTQRLLPVFDYMKAHLQEDLSVEKLARVACLSPSRFFSLFQEQMSISPMAYLRKQRVAEACKLLIATNRPMSMIATETGFASQFHFSRTFKAQIGTSPSDYRKWAW